MFGKVCKLTIDDGNCYNINTKVLDWHLGLKIETQPKLYMEVDKSCEGIVRWVHQVDSGNLMVEAFTENVMTHGKIKAKLTDPSEEVERCVGEPQLPKAMEEVAKGGELVKRAEVG
nr:hypothetical protein Iba_scaffold35592CG0020 [Ipomoea batatas]